MQGSAKVGSALVPAWVWNRVRTPPNLALLVRKSVAPLQIGFARQKFMATLRQEDGSSSQYVNVGLYCGCQPARGRPDGPAPRKADRDSRSIPSKSKPSTNLCTNLEYNDNRSDAV